MTFLPSGVPFILLFCLVDEWVASLPSLWEGVILFAEKAALKGLSYEIDFENVDKN
jgi:hypothetical protein